MLTRRRFVWLAALSAASCASLQPRPDDNSAGGQQTANAEPAVPAAVNVTTDKGQQQCERKWYEMTAGTIPDWFMLLITGFGVRAAFRTLDKLEDQTNAAIIAANAAKASSDGFKLANRQWINIRKCRFAVEAGGPCFSFEIKNSTPLPFTITRIVVLSSIAGDAIDIQGIDYWMTPQELYPVGFELIKADVMGLFARGERAVADVVGTIYFTDAFGEKQTHIFGRKVIRQATGNILVRTYGGGLKHTWTHLLEQHPDIQGT